MSASNYTWVCFDCRTITRKPKRNDYVPKCNICEDQFYCLGYKFEIPKQRDVKAWEKLRDKCLKRDIEAKDFKIKSIAKRKSYLLKEISKLELLEENKDRRKVIDKYKQELSDLD